MEIELQAALVRSLGELDQPVVTSYQVGTLLFSLYRTRRYQGYKLARIGKPFLSREDFTQILKQLESNGVLQQGTNVRSKDVFTVLGREHAPSEEIVCCVDPFAYISHLSAMVYHGLSARIPKVLFISSPPPAQWRQFAQAKMQKDLGENLDAYLSANLPQLTRLAPRRVNRLTVNRYSSLHRGAFTNVKGSALRVSRIGRTFLDMIREPGLCGGIYHMLEVYKESAEQYLNLIVDEIDRHGTKIDKVRAGYILEERGGLSHPVFEHWHDEAVQRGGSRKLDAESDYSATYSARWGLSLNIEE